VQGLVGFPQEPVGPRLRLIGRREDQIAPRKEQGAGRQALFAARKEPAGVLGERRTSYKSRSLPKQISPRPTLLFLDAKKNLTRSYKSFPHLYQVVLPAWQSFPRP